MAKISSAEYVITLLDGPTATARLITRPITTVQSWFDRGRIPSKYWPDLIAAAKAQRKKLDYADFLKEHEDGKP